MSLIDSPQTGRVHNGNRGHFANQTGNSEMDWLALESKMFTSVAYAAKNRSSIFNSAAAIYTATSSCRTTTTRSSSMPNLAAGTF